MAIRSDRDKPKDVIETDASEVPADLDATAAAIIDPTHPQPVLDSAPEPAPVQLGTQRYVHAAFFAAGILLAYIAGKTLAGTWSRLADWPTAARAIPQLVSYPEDERDAITMAAGAFVGLVAVVQIYRKPAIRTWADEVAAELGKVSWPNREAVINGTLVVVIASTIATLYVAILDRFWGFVTTLVYGT